MRGVLLISVLALLAGSCAAGSDAAIETEVAIDEWGPSTPSSPPVAPTLTTAPTTSASPTTTVSPATTAALSLTAAPPFRGTIGPVTAEELGTSWREGCPVGPDELRALTLSHWMADGTVADGVLIVHADHAEDLVGVFETLFDAGFPITSMRPVDEFDADDDRSMAADNTSAFNCRTVGGSAGVWSEHAFGRAVDINPLRNPYVRGSTVEPPGGAAFVDRSPGEPGLIVAGDAVTTAFAAIGWGWGGNWSSAQDFQHFSSNGR